VHPARARHLEHLRSEVHAVDRVDAALAQPGAGTASSAAEVGDLARPAHRLERLEQLDVHRVLDGLLVGIDPLAVAAADVHRAVAASVEGRELGHAAESSERSGRPEWTR
jgi:hypothetical protein